MNLLVVALLNLNLNFRQPTEIWLKFTVEFSKMCTKLYNRDLHKTSSICKNNVKIHYYENHLRKKGIGANLYTKMHVFGEMQAFLKNKFLKVLINPDVGLEE